MKREKRHGEAAGDAMAGAAGEVGAEGSEADALSAGGAVSAAVDPQPAAAGEASASTGAGLVSGPLSGSNEQGDEQEVSHDNAQQDGDVQKLASPGIGDTDAGAADGAAAGTEGEGADAPEHGPDTGSHPADAAAAPAAAPELSDEDVWYLPENVIVRTAARALNAMDFNWHEQDAKLILELAAFVRANPSAPEEAGIIHLERKFRVKLLSSDRRLTLLGLKLFKACLLGLDAIDAENKAIDARAPAPSAPFPGGLGFTPEPAPFSATGLSAAS